MRLTTPLAACMAVLLAAGPVLAERVVTAEEFEALVTGKTYHFDRNGAAFGAEQYFEDKRVIWAFEGGDCQRGIWFESTDGQICFVYESDPAPQCWDFIQMPGGDFHARADGSPPADDLVTTDIDTGPLECPAPDLGV